MEEKSNDFKEQLRKVFTIFDKDNDDTILNKELGTVLRLLGKNPTENEIQKMVNDMDCDENGKINFNNFYQVLLNKKQEENTTEEELREAFKIFDKEGNGYIATTELRHILLNLGDKLTDEEYDEIMKEANVDNDGQVYYEEFLSILNSTK